MRKAVIDLGCYTHEEAEESTETLIELYNPDIYYGCDPYHKLEEKIYFHKNNKTLVKIENCAAWIYDGFVAYHEDDRPQRSFVNGGDSHKVRCFDLERLVSIFVDMEIILKLDVEGAEYMLLNNLIDRSSNLKISEYLVEWHSDSHDYMKHKIVKANDGRIKEWL